MKDTKVTKETTIDGIRYQVTKLGGNTGSEVLLRLGKQVFDIAHLSVDEFVYLRDTMAASTKIGIVDTAGDGRVTFVPLASVFDDHFAGNYGPLLEWLAFCVEHNFASFFAVAPKLTQDLMARFRSISLKGASGPSGGSSSPSE